MKGSFDITQNDTLGTFWQRLLSADFMPHGHCYWWKPEIVWLQVLSNSFIALAYFSIPVLVFHFVRRRRDLPFHWMFYMFAAFILCCGLTHVLDVVVIWHPVYRFDGIVRAFTAIISVATATLLYPVIPQALALKSPKELAEKNRQLDEANQKLRASEKLKDEFFAKVSHELRTPLTLIMAPVESLLAGEIGSSPEERDRALRTVHHNAVRLLQMVTSLLDFSRLEAGRMEVKREPTDIATLTKALLSDFAPAFDRKQIVHSLSIRAESVVFSVDRYLYERILFNLLSNALKFTPEGGTVRVSVDSDGDSLILRVADTGIGIPEDEQSSLFQRFHQVDETATRRFEGTGLGLALIKEFALLLDGQVSVESSPGSGSTFTVQFSAPRARVPREETTSVLESKKWRALELTDNPLPVPITTHDHSRELNKVLVVEDNRELSHYIATLLADTCEVRIAPDGKEGLVLAKSWTPDLVISDVMMPGLDGFALCKAIKSNPALASIPVVLLTALTYREALIKGWESGADEYLFKPFHPRELVTRIQSMLRLVKERRARELERSRREELEHFSHLASHDLKEPLRAVTTYSQMIQKRYAGKLDGPGDQYIDFIIEGAIRMQQLIDDLINYSMVSAMSSELNRVSSEDVLKSALRNLGAAITESNVAVTFGSLPEVMGNAVLLTSLFQNLLSNAIKFRGGDKPSVHISAKRLNGEWLFNVVDNGIGLEPQYAEHIFVIFKRLHNQRNYPGTGMGLAICKKIVNQHGGRIWVESEPGKGSNFFFTLRGGTAAGLLPESVTEAPGGY